MSLFKHRVLFIDDRMDEIKALWAAVDCREKHELLPLEPFDSISRAVQLVMQHKPTMVVIGHGLGQPGITGTDVIRALRVGGYSEWIIGNSGGASPFFDDGLRIGVIDEFNIGRKGAMLNQCLSDSNFAASRPLTVNILKQYLQEGRLDDFTATVPILAKDVFVAEQLVAICLCQTSISAPALTVAIDRFVEVGRWQSKPEDHGNWLHSASHFTKNLWELDDQMYAKKVYAQACGKIVEFEKKQTYKIKLAFNCLDRLVGNFLWCAKWDTNPAEYGFTAEVIAIQHKWVGPGPVERTALFPFASEAACVEQRRIWEEEHQRERAKWEAEMKRP